MGDYTPLYISLGIIFIIGFIIPLSIGEFVDNSQPNPNSYVSSISDFVDTGFTISIFGFFSFDINPFSLFGNGFKSFLVSQLNAFSYIPNVISIPLLIIILVGLVVSLITIFKPFA
jgi:hypothetical protein